jgi:peptidoglycan hydrolase CwlO-like protein
MGIQYFDSEEEMDAAFEAGMEAAQEEWRLKNEIAEAEQRVAEARDDLTRAEEELKELEEQLKELSV